MFKEVNFNAALNEVTGYGIHATNFQRELANQLVRMEGGTGTANITLVDAVSIQDINSRLPYPSILYSVWESTEWPSWFLEKLTLFDQLWVASEWQKACSISQGIPEEFIRVVPEGVNPDIFYPVDHSDKLRNTFDFLHVGKWEHRKSTAEICAAFMKAFPDNDEVRLLLAVDTNFATDNYGSTEERLKAYGLDDRRIVPVHFLEKDKYVSLLQSAHVFVSCSRAEGWGLPMIESMACGVPTIVADYSGSTEYAMDALKVRVNCLKKPEGIYGNWDVPGFWGEPNYERLAEVMRDAYENYKDHKVKALKTAEFIRTQFS